MSIKASEFNRLCSQLEEAGLDIIVTGRQEIRVGEMKTMPIKQSIFGKSNGDEVRPLQVFADRLGKSVKTLMRHVTGEQLPQFEAFKIGRLWYSTDDKYNLFLYKCQSKALQRKPVARQR